MILKDLINELELLPREKVVSYGFGAPMSWRGSYDELAFSPKEKTTIGEMLDHAKSAKGSAFEGYKGGEYTMSEWTDVHIAEYGGCGEPINSANIRLWSV